MIRKSSLLYGERDDRSCKKEDRKCVIVMSSLDDASTEGAGVQELESRSMKAERSCSRIHGC